MSTESAELASPVHELRKVLDTTVTELLSSKSSTSLCPVVRWYAAVLYAYLTCDLDGLRACRRNVPSGSSFPEAAIQILNLLSEVRLAIREKCATPELLGRLASTEIDDTTSLLEGERQFVLGLGYDGLSDFDASREAFLKSHDAFNESQLPRKAVKALLNATVSDSRINPDKKLIADYYHVATLARKAGESPIAGTCLLNISREYQKLGSSQLALKYCNDAIEELSPEFGTLHYYLAVLHRCHVLCELGRWNEALLDLQTAQGSGFPEIQAALPMVTKMFKREKLEIPSVDLEGPDAAAVLTPTWRERASQLLNRAESHDDPKKRLSPQEASLLRLLSQGPKDKFELIEALFGDESTFTLLEDRLKNLLLRLRKKRPDLILYENGKYRISDPSFLSRVSSELKAGSAIVMALATLSLLGAALGNSAPAYAGTKRDKNAPNKPGRKVAVPGSAARPWLVRIESTYFDLKKKKNVRVKGAGFILSDSRKLYVATAHHVFGGEDVTIHTESGATIPVENAATSALDDSALIQVNGVDSTGRKLEPLGTISEASEGIAVRSELTAKWFSASWSREADPATVGVVIPGETRVLSRGDFVPIPTTARPVERPSPASIKESMATGIVKRTLYPFELFVSFRLSPGCSGAPLIRLNFNQGQPSLEVAAVVTRYSPFRQLSHFVDSRSLIKLYGAMSKPELIATEQGFWKMYGGFTFRVMGKKDAPRKNQIAEVDFLTQTIAAVTDLPSGNGTLHDGGNGTLHDGTDDEHPLEDALNGGRKIFADAGLRAGLLWYGSPVHAFRVTSKSRNEGALVYASIQALYLFSPEITREYDVEPVFTDGREDFLGYLRSRASSLKHTPRGERFGLDDRSETRRSSLKFLPETGTIALDLRYNGSDLSFEMNSKGGILRKGAQPMEFQPMLQLGKTSVDLRELFFLEPSLHTPGNKEETWLEALKYGLFMHDSPPAVRLHDSGSLDPEQDARITFH